MLTVRPAAVAGAFYPSDARTLEREVAALLAAVESDRDQRAYPKAIIAPHAGYVYSGPIAASAYARVSGARDTIRRVVLLGPAHRTLVHGLALPTADAFATPLGVVPIDPDDVARLRALPFVSRDGAAHALEHSLEVHVPFLQSVLGQFSLTPLVVGDASPQQVAEVLAQLWGGAETLIVVSSDLSHYLPYRFAREVDGRTSEAILALDAQLDHVQACGATPINGLLLEARRRQLSPRLLDLRNSGDTAGDKHRVVGYAAFEFHG